MLTKQQQAVVELLGAIVSIAESKRLISRGHSAAVAHYADILAQELELGEEERERIHVAALLHDIGYVAVPEALVTNLSPTTWDQVVIRSHPVVGAELLAGLPWLADAASYVRHHHEHYDGGGYPDGLSEDKFPLGAQVLALAEYFVNLTSPAWGKKRDLTSVVEIMKGRSGKRFEAGLLDSFIAAVKESFSSNRERFRSEVAGRLSDLGSKLIEEGAELPVMTQIVELLKPLLPHGENFDRVVSYVEADPGLTLRVITASNSAAFGGLEKIKDARQAVLRLGLSEVQVIVTSLESSHLFLVQTKGRPGQAMNAWWRQALFCALAGRVLAQATKAGDPLVAYYVGLLRGIGRAVLLRAYDEEFSTGELSEAEFEILVGLVEQQSWPVTHWILQQAEVVSRWIDFAAPMSQESLTPSPEPETRVLAVADLLARGHIEAELRSASVVRYLYIQEILASATLNLSQEMLLKCLGRIWELYQVVYRG